MKHSIMIVCDCNSSEHQMIINKFDDENEAYVSIHLTSVGLLRRIKQGFKHIFGYKCKYGSFEEIIINKENTEQLYEMLKEWHGTKRKQCVCPKALQ